MFWFKRSLATGSLVTPWHATNSAGIANAQKTLWKNFMSKFKINPSHLESIVPTFDS